MKEEDDRLPLEALPNLIRLVGFYNRSLEELVSLFKIEGSALPLTKQFDYLVNDFNFFEQTYQHWYAELNQTEKAGSLLPLKALLDESKGLITQTIGLIQH